MLFRSDKQRKAVFANLSSSMAGLHSGAVSNLNRFSNDSLFAMGASVTSGEDYDDKSYGKEKYKVCDRCEGKGRHDPKWLSGGITRSDRDEDPEFFEEYMDGKYDVPCETCKGQRVVSDIVSPKGYEIVTHKYPIHEDPSGEVYFYDEDYSVLKDGEFVKEFDDRVKAIRFIKKEEGLIPKTTGIGKKLKSSPGVYSSDPKKVMTVNTNLGPMLAKEEFLEAVQKPVVVEKKTYDIGTYGRSMPEQMQEYTEKNKRGVSLGQYAIDGQ